MLTRSFGRCGALAVCGGSAAAGALVGLALAAGISAESRAALTEFMTGYGSALLGGAGMPKLSALLWSAGKWPLAAFLLAFTGLGVTLVPALLALRCGLLASCVSVLTRTLAGRGALMGLLLFGLENLVTLPVLLILAVQSWEAARMLNGRALWVPGARPPLGAWFWLKALLCAAAVALSVLVENFALPLILKATATFFVGT